jgi:hypothetical protein
MDTQGTDFPVVLDELPYTVEEARAALKLRPCIVKRGNHRTTVYSMSYPNPYTGEFFDLYCGIDPLRAPTCLLVVSRLSLAVIVRRCYPHGTEALPIFNWVLRGYEKFEVSYDKFVALATLPTCQWQDSAWYEALDRTISLAPSLKIDTRVFDDVYRT